MSNNQIIFDKKTIIDFSKNQNFYNAQNMIFQIYDLLCSITDELKATGAPISGENYNFELINQLRYESINNITDIEMLFIVDAPQIHFNTIERNKKKFSKYFKKFISSWKNVRNQKRRKRKRNKAKQETNNIQIKEPSKYCMQDFQNDMFKKLIQSFSDITYISMSETQINIYALEEIGYNIKIIFALQSNDDEIKIFNSNTCKFTNIKYGDRDNNVSKKSFYTKGRIYPMMRVFNQVYYNVMNHNINSILLESILCDIPDIFYSEDIYISFIKIINYIYFNTIQNMKSITDNNKLINNEQLINGQDIFDFTKFINVISKYI